MFPLEDVMLQMHHGQDYTGELVKSDSGSVSLLVVEGRTLKSRGDGIMRIGVLLMSATVAWGVVGLAIEGISKI